MLLGGRVRTAPWAEPTEPSQSRERSRRRPVRAGGDRLAAQHPVSDRMSPAGPTARTAPLPYPTGPISFCAYTGLLSSAGVIRTCTGRQLVVVELGDAHPLAGRDRLRLIHGHRPDRSPKRGLWGRWRAASVLHRRSLRAGQPSPRRTPALPIPWPSGSEQQTVAFALDVVDGVIERTRDERAQLQSLQASSSDALLAGRVRVAAGES